MSMITRHIVFTPMISLLVAAALRFFCWLQLLRKSKSVVIAYFFLIIALYDHFISWIISCSRLALFYTSTNKDRFSVA